MNERRYLSPRIKKAWKFTDTIKIDFSSIPDYVKEHLAATFYKSITEFLKQPGNKEMLDAEIAAMKAKKK